MASGYSRIALLVMVLLVVLASHGFRAAEPGDAGFQALPRPISYATPLAQAGGVRAVLVYGREAPWTRDVAESVRTTLAEWSGQTLELADDHAVTSDETWLVAEAWRRTPLVVIGNAQDNRVMHALGTRYLLQSNRSWPGGDRYVLRTVFEPFVADVNFVLLEASTEAGGRAAAVKLAELLNAVSAADTAAATIPLLRAVGGVKDAWAADGWPWTPPAEYGDPAGRSVTQIAADFKGTPATAGSALANPPALVAARYVYGGGIASDRANPPTLSSLGVGKLKVAAAMFLNGCRAVGGRAHLPADHYGAMPFIVGLRAAMQAGILTAAELNELESCMVLSAADPNEYWYENMGRDSGFLNEQGDRHAGACLLLSLHLLDYVREHCRLDEHSRRELDRRANGARKTTARYVRSFRDNFDTWELSETTMLYLYAMLHQGMPENIRNGNLRLSADCYILTSDNLPDHWEVPGCYAGLDSYIGAGAGMVRSSWHGRGLVAAAAFYYDDPQYRWFVRNSNGRLEGIHGSVAAQMLPMHWDSVAPARLPERYNGVSILPFDERLYDLATNVRQEFRWLPKRPEVPAPRDRLVDRVAIRDGMTPADAYLFLATSQCLNGPDGINALQSNSIARYSDLGDLWLYTNTKTFTGWSRSMVSISNGKSHQPYAACTLEARANLGDFSLVASRDHGVGGADWTRAIVHWRGHYFAVLDRIEALTDDEYNLICRWRGVHPARLQGTEWLATAAGGGVLHVQSADGVPQTSEHWESDGGGARPFVLSQYRRARLAKGQVAAFGNLLYVAGETRADEFQTRRVSPNALLVKGHTATGDHVALVATKGPPVLAELETDAEVYCVGGDVLYLAAVRMSKLGGRELLWADAPVNFSLDCATGCGELEVIGAQPAQCRVGEAWGERRPGRSAVELPRESAIPRPAGLLETLWQRSAAVAAPTLPTAGSSPFATTTAAEPLRAPLRRLSLQVSATPKPVQAPAELADWQYMAWLANNSPTWPNTAGLEITLTFPEPVPVDCLRLVSIMRAGLTGRENWSQPWHEAGDFSFTLTLSDDGFQRDVRTLDQPEVQFENTPLFGAIYYSLSRLPTWRIALGQRARQVRLRPRALRQDKPELCLTEVEAYAPGPGDELSVNASVADLNGDGANELVIGSSNQELAAYAADGTRLWTRSVRPHDVYTLACEDLDDDGKAEVLLYTTEEKLHRLNGDGTEREPVTDLYEGQIRDPAIGFTRTGGIGAMAAWRPDPQRTAEVALFAQGTFFARDDGSLSFTTAFGEPRGAGRIRGLFPNEPEVMAGVNSSCVVWSGRRDDKGQYVRLGQLSMTGAGGAACSRSFGWIRPVNTGRFKGLLAANEGGVDWLPVEAFAEGSQVRGWGFDTGGVPVRAALAEDLDGDGLPEVCLGRQDGFVNVFRLEQGATLGLLNTGEPILGLAGLRVGDGRVCLAVGTRFGVHLYDHGLQPLGKQAVDIVAFAGPGGRDDRVFVVDAHGAVQVLMLK